MPIDPEVSRRIIEAFVARSADGDATQIKVCPLCGVQAWSTGDGFVTLTVVDAPLKIGLGGEAYPLFPLVCRNCGNTILLNLYALGLDDVIVALNPDAKRPAAADASKNANDG